MTLFTPPTLLNSPRWHGLRIGILGGSFNPPHIGHVHISLAAMKGLALDAVWWLVTPQNPLKSRKADDFNERIRQCEAIAQHPKLIVTGLEREVGTQITYHSIKEIKKTYNRHEFVWISGMDNALSLHTWHHWKALLREIPTAHLTRKPATTLIQSCPLRLYGRQNHVFLNKSGKWPLVPGTTYWMLQKKMVNISSTEIREKRLNYARI